MTNEIQRYRDDRKMSQALSPALQQKMTQIVSQYGDRVTFLNSFSPDKQYTLCADDKAAILGDSPTLTDINICYGNNMSVMFLLPQLLNLSEFCGAKEKFSNRQIEETAHLIAASYPWLKVKEIMTFFKQFKIGQYGRFYGTVDPMVIMSALKEFLVYRNDVYAEYEERIASSEDITKGTVSFEEWKATKEANGEKVHISAYEEKGKTIVREVKSPIENALDTAKSLVTNKHGLTMKTLLDMRKLFLEQNGMTPEDFIYKIENKEL